MSARIEKKEKWLRFLSRFLVVFGVTILVSTIFTLIGHYQDKQDFFEFAEPLVEKHVIGSISDEGILEGEPSVLPMEDRIELVGDFQLFQRGTQSGKSAWEFKVRLGIGVLFFSLGWWLLERKRQQDFQKAIDTLIEVGNR